MRRFSCTPPLRDAILNPATPAHLGISTVLALALALWVQHYPLRGAPQLRIAEQAPTEAAAEAGARETLQKYSAALESLDPNAVKKVQPSIPVDTLAKAFKDMRELKVNIDTVRVLSVEGATTRVSCRVTQTLTPKVGSKRTTAVTRVMRLKRDADGWVIDGFER
jgi:hypothetical protein